ncbi:MAG: hypothetical protein O7D95_06515 [Betaproteobacteria bacterium]|nr:hypothetical protein [Betaproteobacteria bacterium]
MINIPKLFCTLPEGIIIKAMTYCNLNKKIVACTNDGVYLVDKGGNYEKVEEVESPENITFINSGMVSYG